MPWDTLDNGGDRGGKDGDGGGGAGERHGTNMGYEGTAQMEIEKRMTVAVMTETARAMTEMAGAAAKSNRAEACWQ